MIRLSFCAIRRLSRSIRDCGGCKMGAYSIDIVAVGCFILESAVYSVTPNAWRAMGSQDDPAKSCGVKLRSSTFHSPYLSAGNMTKG